MHVARDVAGVRLIVGVIVNPDIGHRERKIFGKGAGAMLRSMATVENGTKWMEMVALQPGFAAGGSGLEASQK